MSGYLYRGRHYGGNREGRPKSMVDMSDLSCEETDKGPPLHTHSLREFEQHLTDLKKENFSLKLRIYFLEERFQQRFEDSSSEDVHRRNIELKVEVESLKRELQEKQQQLDEAQTAAENLTNENEAEAERHCEEGQREIRHLQEVLETKIQMLEEEARAARAEAQRMASELDNESVRAQALERQMMEREEEEGRENTTTLEALAEKDRLIEELRRCMSSTEAQLRVTVEEKCALGERVQELSSTLQQRERDAQFQLPNHGGDRSHTEREMQVWALSGVGL
ncbi:hypothetical protein AALO_G00129910 [Alosa alosa]|uniref:Centrosomin N-terminal motif 1 domain-containing protein n=1 Tax=Alosa alosa TaxID=278164 RepID=A0AAV6GPA4_9TELE|nr:hypothetical protein AALO_G00129910 [Alosa alosa]